MQYLIQIFAGGSMEAWEAMSEPEQQAVTGEYYAISGRAGVIGGERLEPPSTATTIRVQDGQTLATDGPFAETKEALGGFYLFEAEDIDAAIELAAAIPAARLGGAVEIRPVAQR